MLSKIIVIDFIKVVSPDLIKKVFVCLNIDSYNPDYSLESS